MWEFVIQQNSVQINPCQNFSPIDRLPSDTVVVNEHEPLLGHVETEICRKDVFPYNFHTFHINPNTVAVRVRNASDAARFITTTIRNGFGYELIPRNTPGVTYSELLCDHDTKGFEFEISGSHEAELWIHYKCHEKTEGKVMEMCVEMIDPGDLERKFYFLYLRGKVKKLKKVGEKFVKSCDEFWESEVTMDKEALKRRIFFITAVSVED